MGARRWHLWAGSAAACLYGLAYLAAWWPVWSAPSDDRDGLEWIFVMLLTLPWCALPLGEGWTAAHVGALINGSSFSLVVFVIARWWAGRSEGRAGGAPVTPPRQQGQP